MQPPIKTNPGGEVSPRETLGRDEFIERLWDILPGQSIYMNDLRRIGKTQIMKKMTAEPRAGWATVYRDVSFCGTAAEFATMAYRLSHEVLGQQKRTLRRMGELLGKAAGTEIAGLIKLPDGSAAPWKEVLSRTFADIDEEMKALGPNRRMIFFWDEVPYLIGKIAKNDSPAIAMEVLDVLRALGQDHDRVRLVLTGSIGLHHVLEALKRDGYHGSPLNRMASERPGPLEPAEALVLAQRLIAGSGLTCEDAAQCATIISTAVGHVPFYIQKLISRLPKATPLTKALIHELLDREISSDHNDWDLRHYRDRLRTYYGDEETLALHILDTTAIDGDHTFNTIRKAVNAQMAVDDERLRQLLKLLCMDHYLVRSGENGFCFYLEIIRRWWRLDRCL
ncbi:MAG: hypothetical protein ACKVY0_16295 [Prosthecobacter sp.]|uniref:hypothetical protein n=1 Tax=Prosthecobacter sp. TaxID=1965333 RepID=UPI0039015030